MNLFKRQIFRSYIYYHNTLLTYSLERHWVTISAVNLTVFWSNSEVTELDVEGRNTLASAHKDSYDSVEFNVTKY